jgi:hypothetical protein
MKRDPNSGLRYARRRDEQGRRFRDLSISGQVDDRFEIDDATGELVQVRDKVSHQVLDFGAALDRWPDGSGPVAILSCWSPEDEDETAEPELASGTHGRETAKMATLDIGQGPPDALARRTRRPSLDSILKAARKNGASVVRLGGGVEIVLDPSTDETGGDEISRLLAKSRKKTSQ